jgi:hypothetical protein
MFDQPPHMPKLIQETKKRLLPAGPAAEMLPFTEQTLIIF